MQKDYNDSELAKIARGVNEAVADLDIDGGFAYREDDTTEVKRGMKKLLETCVWGTSGTEYWGNPEDAQEWISALTKQYLYYQSKCGPVRETMGGY